MKLEIAIEVLKLHNKWRRCNDDSIEQCNSKDIGEAIDTVVNHYDHLNKKQDAKENDK